MEPTEHPQPILDLPKTATPPGTARPAKTPFPAVDVPIGTSPPEKEVFSSAESVPDSHAISGKSSKLTFRGKHFLSLIEFDANEQLVCEIRKHPFGLFVIYLLGGAISTILFAALVVAPYAISTSGEDFGFDLGPVRPILALVGLLLASASLVMTAITAYLYQSNVVLVTNEKIAQQLYRTLFDKKISQLSIGDIQDVTVSQRGVFAKIFGFGTLIVETAGEQNNYVFNYSIKPYECSKLIVAAQEAYVAKFGN